MNSQNLTGASLPSQYSAWSWQHGDGVQALALTMKTPVAPGAHEVWIRNEVIGLNPVDWKVLGDAELGWQPGHVPGVDGAGTVVAVGEQVAAAWLGQRVVYHQNLLADGSFAEYTRVAAHTLMRVPAGLDMATAASFPCPALTAWQALNKIPCPAQSYVLISGAGGAVGHYLTQLAVRRGLHVFALCHPRHWDRLAQLGAEHFIASVSDDSFAAAGQIFDAVIDAVSEEHAASLVPSLRANGHLVCIQGRLSQWPNSPFDRSLSMHEVALGALHQFGDEQAWHQLTRAGEQLLDDLDSGELIAERLVVGDFAGLPVLLDELKHRTFSGKPLIRLFQRG